MIFLALAGLRAIPRGAPLLAGLAFAVNTHAIDLVGAYRLALAADATYLAARASAQAAREALPQARASLLPQISASVARGRNSTDQTTQGPVPDQTVTRHFDYPSTSASLNLRQPLVRLGNVASYFSAEAQVAVAEATLAQDAQAMALRVAGTYFETLVAREKLQSITNQKEAYAGQLAAAERSFAAGFATRTDIDETRTRLDIAAAQEIEARHAMGAAERALGGLLNQRIQSEALARIDAERLPLDMPRPNDLDSWIARAEEKNPELQALRLSIEVAERELDKGRAAHLPTLDLVASRSKSDSDSNNTIGSKFLTSSIGVQLSIPIYAGGQIDSGVRQARANMEKARHQYEAGRRQVGVAVAREFGAIEHGVAHVRALEQAQRSAEQAVLSSRKGVQAGTRSSVDVLNALQQVSATGHELAKARYTYAFSRLKLKSAAGVLGEEDFVEINGWLKH